MARKVVSNGVFGWCADGHHRECIRQSERFYFEGKKLVYTGEIRLCQCKKRSCKCYKQKVSKKIEDTKPL